MLRNTIGCILAILLGTISVLSIEYVGHSLFPGVEALQEGSHENTSANYLLTAPKAALCFILLAHSFGSIVAGFTIGEVAKTWKKILCLGVGIIFSTIGLINILSIRHPLWFSIIDLASYLPACFLGLALAPSKELKAVINE